MIGTIVYFSDMEKHIFQFILKSSGTHPANQIQSILIFIVSESPFVSQIAEIYILLVICLK
jgi:hypothetical protein